MDWESVSGKQIGMLQDFVSACSERISEARNSVSSADWRELERTVFVHSLQKGISELAEIKAILEKIQGEVEKQALPNAPEVSEITQDYAKTLEVLKRNFEMEQAKKSRAKEINLLEKDSQPELYASLQQKILSLLLKTGYLNERLTIFARKQNASPLPEKSTAKQVMELLEKKETELQDLKSRYDGIRKKSFMGLIEEKTISDLETDVNGIEKAIAKNYSAFEQNLAHSTSHIDAIQAYLADSRQKFSQIKDSLEEFSSKSAELSKSLKKERDYAKKIALDLEHETMQLRGSYTQEILGLQEAKLSAKKEAEEKSAKRISALQKELFEKEELAKHFRKMAEEKHEKEKKLEEKIRQLQLLVKTKEKHDSVKRHFEKRTKMQG